MSALGHFIEEEGIATVAISLVRPQTENTRPPRALWVPFELGRSFGPPSDPPFQKKVILSALRLLELEAGPVVLADFPEDDPRARPDPLWRPPIGEAAGLEDEIARLAAAYDRSVAERGRTTVGLSSMPIGEIGRWLAAWLRGEAPASPNPEMSAPLALRFAVDDLKAYCLEAAIAGGTRPSSRQLADWFWNETVAGKAVIALRQANLDAADDRLKLIAGNFLVPAARVLAMSG